MERIDIDRILKKMDIKEEDIISIGETWGFNNPIIDNESYMVRRKFKTYDIVLKDGAKLYLKMNALTNELRSKDEVGYNLMVE